MGQKSPCDMSIEELLTLPKSDAFCQLPNQKPTSRNGGRAASGRTRSQSPEVEPSQKFHARWTREHQDIEPCSRMRDLAREKPWCPDMSAPRLMCAHAAPPPEQRIGVFDPDEVDWHFFQQALKKIKEAAKRNEIVVDGDGNRLTEELLKARQLLKNRGSIEEIEARLRAKGKIYSGKSQIKKQHRPTVRPEDNVRATLAILVAEYCDDHLDPVSARLVQDTSDASRLGDVLESSE